MVIRPLRHGDDVDGLVWRCRRELICSGSRRIRDPLVVQPMADASTQAIFEWERSRDRRGWNGPSTQMATPSGGRRFFGLLGRAMPRPTTRRVAGRASAVAQADGPLAGLIDHGYVVLDDRHVATARAPVDHLVIGPTGVFVVDRKTWPGQISASNENVYVDGRLRTGATDAVLRATAAVEDVLAHELRPLGATVRPVISFDSASSARFEATIGKIALCGARSLGKVIRTGPPTLGPETVVRLSLAADRLLD